MQLTSHSIQDGQPIPAEFAFGKFHPNEHVALAANRNPHLAWSGVPDGVKRFALLCVDPDVPADAGDANQEGKTLPAEAPRVDFYHWVMVDIPGDWREIQAGACSDGVKPGGKPNPPGPEGSRQGLNNYTQFMRGSDMAGEYFGYDGPGPPWNDERLHHYHFKLFALDIERLPVEGKFTGPEVVKAIEGHVLAQAEIIGTYSLNPDVRRES